VRRTRPKSPAALGATSWGANGHLRHRLLPLRRAAPGWWL